MAKMKSSPYENALKRKKEIDRTQQEQQEQQKKRETEGTKLAVAGSAYDQAIKNFFSDGGNSPIGNRLQKNMGTKTPHTLLSTGAKPFDAYDRFITNQAKLSGKEMLKSSPLKWKQDPYWWHDRSEEGTAPYKITLPDIGQGTKNAGATGTVGGGGGNRFGFKPDPTKPAGERKLGYEDYSKVQSMMPGGKAYDLQKLMGEGINHAQGRNKNGTYEHMSSKDVRERSAWAEDVRNLGILDESEDWRYHSDQKLRTDIEELRKQLQEQGNAAEDFDQAGDEKTRRALKSYYGENEDEDGGIFFYGSEGKVQISGGRPEGYDEDYGGIGLEADDAVYSAITGAPEGTYKAVLAAGTEEEKDSIIDEVEGYWQALEESGSADEAFRRIRGYDLDERQTAAAGIGSQEIQREIDAREAELQTRAQLQELEENAARYNDGAYHEDLNRTSTSYHYEYGARLAGGDKTDQAYYKANHRFLEGNTNPFGEYSGEGTEYYQELGPDADPVYFMTDDQREVFNRYYNAGDKESAQAYLDGLNYALLANRSAWLQYYDRERASDPNTGWLTTIDTFLKNPIGGIKGTAGAVAAILGNESAANPNSQWYDETRSVRDIRDVRGKIWGEGLQDLYAWATGEKNNEFALKAGNFLYGVFTSMGDMGGAMATSMAFGGGAATQGIVQMIMSSEAASMSMVENLEANKNPTEAGLMAIGSGIIEAVTEKYSIEALLSDPVSLKGYLLKNTFTEGAEEVASDLLNTVADSAWSLVWGHRTEIEKDYQDRLDQLIGSGVKKEEAEKQAAQETLLAYLKGLGTDFLAGAMSGFAMSGGRAAVDGIANSGTKRRSAKANALMESILKDREKAAKRAGEFAKTATESASGKMASGEQLQVIRGKAGAADGTGSRTAPGQDRSSRPMAIYDFTDESGNTETRSGEIVRKEGNAYIVQDADGNETRVDAAEAKAADEVTAAAMNFAEVSGIDDQGATALLEAVQDEHVTMENVQDVLEGSQDMITRGYLQETVPEDTKMAPHVAEALYKAGAQQARADEANRKTRAGGGTILHPGEGQVTFQNVDRESLSDTQKQQAEAASAIAKKIGFNLIFIQDTDNKGMFGEYDAATNSVVINLAGEHKMGTGHHLMVAMAHEMTHMLENNSPEAYAELKKFVFDEMRRNGGDAVARVRSKMDSYNLQISKMQRQYSQDTEKSVRQMQQEGASEEDIAGYREEREQGQTQSITLGGAVAEVVADACDQVLGNEKLIRQMAEEHPSLYQKVKNFVADFISKVREATAGMRASGSIDSLYMEDMDKLAEKWGIALRDVTSKAEQNSQETDYEEENTSGSDENAQQSQFSYRNTIDEDYSSQFKRLASNNFKWWKRNDTIVFAKTTPQIYSQAGFRTDVPITMLLSGIKKATRTTATSTQSAHGIDINKFRNADQAIQNPYFYIVEPSRNSIVAFTDITNNGKPVAIPITGGVKHDNEISNEVVSAFGLRNAEEYILNILQKNNDSYIVENENNAAKVLQRADTIPAVQDLLQRYYGNIAQNSLARNTQLNKNQTQLSLEELDADYMQAVEEGNTEKLQAMVDRAAEAAFKDSKARTADGKLMKIYHGTDADFYTFDTSIKGGKNGTAEGFGIYLADTQEVTSKYGARQISGYVNMKRPAYGDKKTIKQAELVKVIKAACEQEAEALIEDGYGSKAEALQDTWISNYVYTPDFRNINDAYKAVAANILQSNDNDADIVMEVMNGMAIRDYNGAMDFYHEILTPITGIDGYWQKWGFDEEGGHANILLAFDSSQIKTADPVTYDDNGKAIPLSERFNKETGDIRYSFEEEAPDAQEWILGIDPKDMTGAALEGFDTAANRKLITGYQNGVREIQGIRDTMRQMREQMQKAEDEAKALREKANQAKDDEKERIRKEANAKADEARRYRVNLQTEEGKLQRAQKNLQSLSEDENLGKIMQRAQTTIDTFLRGKTQTEVEDSVRKLKKEAEGLKNAARAAAEALEKQAGREDRAIAQRMLNQQALAEAAGKVREIFSGHGDATEIQDAIGDIALRLITGDADGMMKATDALIDYGMAKDWFNVRYRMNEGKRFRGAADVLTEETRNDLRSQVIGEAANVLSASSGSLNSAGNEGLIAYVRQMAEETRQASRKMRRMEDLARLMQEKGDAAAKATDQMRQQLQAAIRYYDMVNEKNRKAARAEEIEEVTRQLESKAAKRLIEEQEKWRRRMENDRETRRLSQENMAARKTINTAFTRLANLVLNETDQKNIPEGMKPVARAAIRMIINNEAEGGRKITGWNWQQMKNSKRTMDAIDLRDGTSYNLQAIMDAMGVQDDEIGFQIEQALEKIRRGIDYWNSDRGRHMVVLQGDKAALRDIREGIALIYDVSSRAGQIFLDGKLVETSNAAYEVDSEARKKDAYREWQGTFGKLIRKGNKTVVLGNMTPEFFFKNMKNNGISRVYEEFKNGEDRYGRIMLDAKQKIEEISAKYKYGEWDIQAKHEIQLENGRKVNLTLEQMMALYATWKREQTLGPDWSAHLERGGFVYEEESDKKWVGREPKKQTPNRVTTADMTMIESLMTDAQRGYVDEMVGILSKDMSEIGNEASLRMFGIRKYNETYYFPFKIWDGVKNKGSNAGSSANPTNNNRAAHQSFTKRRLQGAQNAIMIGDFTQQCAEHINQMATYATMGQAIENMNRILNFRVLEEGTDPDNATERSVESLLTERYGQDMVDYIRQFMLDLNGGTVQKNAGMGAAMMSLFKKNAVGGSLSVAMQQPLSYIRASTMIDTKWLIAAADPKTYKGSYEEMIRHSGVAVIKDMGKFDMNFARGAADWLSPEALKGKGERIYQKAEDITNALPEKMDQMTWTRMWTAIKMEQHAAHPEMDMASDVFLDMVGKRFNDVMRKTQVYDSVLVKSQLMRSPGWFEKSITAFRAEPTLSLNLMMDALMNLHETGGKKNLAAVLATFLLSAIGQATVKGIMGAGRNPDEKKTLAENFAYRAGSAFISEANPLSLIPGWDNIVTALSGNDINDNAWGMIKTMGTTLQKIWNPPTGEGLNATTGWRYVEDTIGQITQMFTGIPAKNLMRDSRATYNIFLGGLTGKWAERGSSGTVMKYQAIEQITNSDLMAMIQKATGTEWWKTTANSYYERIYEAEKSGNARAAAEMREYLEKGKGKETKAINGGIASLAKKDDGRSAAETADWLLDHGYADDTSWITSQFKEGKISESELRQLYKEHFPDKDADKAIWNWWRNQYNDGEISESVLKQKYVAYHPGKTAEDAEDYVNDRKWTDAKEEYEDGKISEAEVKKAYLQYHPDKTEQDAMDYIWSGYRDEYQDGKITESRAMELYKKYHPGKTDADAKGYFWSQAKEKYMEGGITRSEIETAYKRYYPDAEAEDVWWAMDALDYKKETGKSASGDYYRVHDAIEGNKSEAIGKAVQTVIQHGKTKKGLLSSIEGKWKEAYLGMKDGSPEKVRLKDGIIKALKAAGYTAAEAEKKINGWKEKKKK